MTPIRLILASASPARLATLRSAGIEPEVIVSGVDESPITADTPAELALRLAGLKAEAVASGLDGPAQPDSRHRTHGNRTPRNSPNSPPPLVLGCDSVLELDGIPYGKPHTAEVAIERWRRMRGRSGVLHTGHCLIHGGRQISRGAATVVHFAALSDAEIAAYVATGEPLAVAGAFTLDGLGGAFVSGIEGDPHNVVGVSLPLLRTMLAELGLSYVDLWPNAG